MYDVLVQISESRADHIILVTKYYEEEENEENFYNHKNMKNTSESEKTEYGIFPYLMYYLTLSGMFCPYMSLG